jgi:glycerate kinase
MIKHDMPLKILIIPDKFKGTLTAGEAAQAIASGWRKARPHDEFDLLPMSDGGDGFGEVLRKLLDAKVQSVKTVDAAHRPCNACWWWEPKTKTAVIESAQVIGLAMLPPGKFHPFDLDTFGLGEVIRATSAKGAKRCIIGIGGSATNDGGFGLARALGWEFLDRDGNLIEQWTGLHALARVRAPGPRRWFDELIVAVDVQNPLLGVRGATRVYGPQKGLKTSELSEAERNLRRLAQVMDESSQSLNARRSRRKEALTLVTQKNLSLVTSTPNGMEKLRTHPGAGAAGGLGFGLRAFLGARTEPGSDLFARFAKLDKKLRSADLVVTGEGRIDTSTLMGKGVGEIARRCRELKIPCIGLAGQIAERAKLEDVFTKVLALTQLTSNATAKTKPDFWLERLAARSAEFIPRICIDRELAK